MASPVVIGLVSTDDREGLKNALGGPDWGLESTDTLEEALQRSRGGAIVAAICDSVLPDGHSWTDLLKELESISHPPAVIIAARHGDSRLWAEVLNLGGWDVVVKPFRRDELLYVLGSVRLATNKH